MKYFFIILRENISTLMDIIQRVVRLEMNHLMAEHKMNLKKRKYSTQIC